MTAQAARTVDPEVLALRTELARLRELHELCERDNRAQRRHYVETIVRQRDHIANLRHVLKHGAGGDVDAALLAVALRLDAGALARLGCERRFEDERFIGELVAERIAARVTHARRGLTT